MISRRTFSISGIASIIAFGSSNSRSTFAQTPAPAEGMEYQGVLLVQNLPTLPTAPAGECAVVLWASSNQDSVAIVYHNATDQVMAVNSVSGTATNQYGTESVSVPEMSNHGPHILQPGEYGIGTPTFDSRLDEDDTVTVEIVSVPESEADPAVVSLPITSFEIVENGDSTFVNTSVTNRTETTLAEGCGGLTIFLTPDGQILDWISSNSLREFEAGGEKTSESGAQGLKVSDSYMAVFGGRVMA